MIEYDAVNASVLKLSLTSPNPHSLFTPYPSLCFLIFNLSLQTPPLILSLHLSFSLYRLFSHFLSISHSFSRKWFIMFKGYKWNIDIQMHNTHAYIANIAVNSNYRDNTLFFSFRSRLVIISERLIISFITL